MCVCIYEWMCVCIYEWMCVCKCVKYIILILKGTQNQMVATSSIIINRGIHNFRSLSAWGNEGWYARYMTRTTTL